MVKDDGVNVVGGRKALLRVANSYFSAVFMMLLACILSTPLAWLTVTFGLPEDVFLALSILPLSISIYIVQSRRLDVRVLEAILASVFKLKVDISEIYRVREVNRIWNETRQLSKELAADWSELYDLVNLANREISNFNQVATEREGVARKFLDWVTARGAVSATVGEVSLAKERYNELRSQLNDLEGKISNYNKRIVAGAESLLADAERRDLQLARWNELKLELASAEKLLTSTFWTWAESLWRHQWVSTQERLNQRKRKSVINWLAKPFDPSPVAQRHQRMLKPMVGKHIIHCSDGEITLSIEG